MWIFSKHGFYSIVQFQEMPADPATPTYLVRARVRADLATLATACDLKAKLVHKAGADYEWRVRADADEFARIFAWLGLSITYPNFKGQIGVLPAMRLRVPLYHQVWALLKERLPILGKR